MNTIGTSRGGIAEIRLDLIRDHPHNPRRTMPVEGLAGLAASMDAVGLTHSIVVMESDDGYVLLAGHRRTAAARLLTWESIEAQILPTLGLTLQIEMLVVENLQREDLRPVEEAHAFDALVKAGYSQKTISERVGCNQSHVSRRLALLELPEDLQERVDAGTVSVGAALATLQPKKVREPVYVPEIQERVSEVLALLKAVAQSLRKGDTAAALICANDAWLKVGGIDEDQTVTAAQEEPEKASAEPDAPPSAEAPDRHLSVVPDEETTIVIGAATGPRNTHRVNCVVCERSICAAKTREGARTAAETHLKQEHEGRGLIKDGS